MECLYRLQATFPGGANGAFLHTKRFFQSAYCEQFFILEDFQRGIIGQDFAVFNDNGPFAYFQHHVEVVGRDYPGMLERMEQLDQPPPGTGVQ